MTFGFIGKTLVFGVAVLAGRFIYNLFKPKKVLQLQYHSEVRFITRRVGGQRHVLMNKYCGEKSCPCTTFRWLLGLLDGATKRIDVAMYFLTFAPLADALIRAKRRGVAVRLIMEYEYNSTGSQWIRFKREGMSVKTIELPLSRLMHLKLILIDGNTALVGSLNWTHTGVTENYEEILCTTNPAITRRCYWYFDDCWRLINEHNKFLTMCGRKAHEMFKRDSSRGKWD